VPHMVHLPMGHLIETALLEQAFKMRARHHIGAGLKTLVLGLLSGPF